MLTFRKLVLLRLGVSNFYVWGLVLFKFEG